MVGAVRGDDRLVHGGPGRPDLVVVALLPAAVVGCALVSTAVLFFFVGRAWASSVDDQTAEPALVVAETEEPVCEVGAYVRCWRDPDDEWVHHVELFCPGPHSAVLALLPEA